MNNGIFGLTLTTEPVTRYTANQTAICKAAFEMEPYKEGDPPVRGEVVAWGAKAEALQGCKGSLLVMGSLQFEVVEHEGYKEYRPVIQAQSIEALASSANSINLVGRLGRDPDVKYFESGAVKAEFTIAIDRRFKDNVTDWFSIECWAKTAEIAANYCRKGHLVGVSGSLKCDTWLDRNSGEPRYKIRINTNNLYLLGSRKDNEAAAASYAGADEGESYSARTQPHPTSGHMRQPVATPAAVAVGSEPDYDEIPF